MINQGNATFDELVVIWMEAWAKLQASVGAAVRASLLALARSVREQVEKQYGEAGLDALADRVRPIALLHPLKGLTK